MSKFQENTQTNQNSQNNQSQTNSSVESELSWNAILTNAIAPLIPALMAKLTGHKLPIPTNTAPNDQVALQQLTPVIQNLVNTQNILLQEIILLKNNAQVIANNFQGLKLTREKQQIEYNQNQNSNDYE